jgi:hypothetical protein
MFRRGPRRPAPPAPSSAAQPGGLLQAYGARLAPDFDGHWVYAFADRAADGAAGPVWYVGQTGSLWSRWRDHYYRWKARFTRAYKYVIPVRGEAEASIVELALINFYQPECNAAGTTADLARKVASYNKGNHYKRDQAVS